MVLATPVRRSGSAGGMQSTARLVGQTLGATLVTLIFALTTGTLLSVRVSLWLGAAMSVIAALLSLIRSSGVSEAQRR